MDNEKLNRAVDEAIRLNGPAFFQVVIKANKAGRSVTASVEEITSDAQMFGAEFQGVLQEFASQVKRDLVDAARVGVGNWG